MEDEQHSLGSKTYGKRPLWQWLVIYAGIAVIVYGLIYYFFLKKNNPYSSQTNSYSQSQQMPEQSSLKTGDTQNASLHTVQYTSDGFKPNTITIKKGETVTWVNKDSDPMWVASNPHPTHTDYPGFDELSSVENNGTYSFTFEKVGTWGYHNHLSPGNLGTVIVK